MKKSLLFVIFILIIPFLNSYKTPFNGNKPYVEGEIMVKLYCDLPQNQQQMLQDLLVDFQGAGLSMVNKLSDRMNIFLLSYNPALIDDDRLLQEIKSHPFVELAQFNHFIELREFIPNDDDFMQQWNMHNTGQSGGVGDADIDGPEGWGISTSGVAASGDTIIIAVVDDGFDLEHEDLNFWKNYHEIPGNGIDDDLNGYIDDYHGWNSWNNSGNLVEKDHGSHVTGIAAAKGNNGIGVTGVNMNVKVLPVVGSATVESIVVGGYSYVYEMRKLYNETNGQKGAFIVSSNSSFGTDGDIEDFPIWAAMYDSMGMQGILSAAATINAALNIDVVGDIPTAFPNEALITVTNTTDEDKLNDYAAYGPTTIDIGAPGSSVYSTRWNNTYGLKTGTSMASPHVAGAVAYLFSVADANFMQAYKADPAGMALVIKQYILNSVDPLPTLLNKTVSGGRLNIYKAAQQLLNPDITFDPMSILQMMNPDEQDAVTLSFTNNSASAINYNISYSGSYPWLSLTGATSGSLAGYANGSVGVGFNTDGMAADTILAYLTFNYGSGEHFNIPVHLMVGFVGVSERGSGDAGKQETLVVWPNPAKEILNFKFLILNSGTDYSIGIYNVAGDRIKEIAMPNDMQTEMKVNLKDLKQGVYILVLKQGNQILAETRFIKLD
jgi:hypothetical protein